ncbi:MAG: hydratase [Cyanobacteria bacterium J06632_22]
MPHTISRYGLLAGFALALTAASPASPFTPPPSLTQRPHPLAQGYTGVLASTLYNHYDLAYPAPVVTTGLSARQIGEVRFGFVRRAVEALGPIVGYKAAFTSPPAQERFGLSEPLYGFLLADMLLDNGASLPVDFAARPLAEGDLLVRVGSADINTAQTDAEILASLEAVIPFIELPDLLYEEDARLDAGAVFAINLGARSGVMGTPIPLDATEDWQTRLGNIDVRMTNTAGQTIGTGNSSALLGHPINVVRWLRDTLAAQGLSLRPGDVLSLGTITPPVPIEADTTLTVEYDGLSDQTVTVSVSFTETD